MSDLWAVAVNLLLWSGIFLLLLRLDRRLRSLLDEADEGAAGGDPADASGRSRGTP